MLKLDGSRPMTGDLAFGTTKLNESASNLLGVRKVSDSSLANFEALIFYSQYLTSSGTHLRLRCGPHTTSKIYLESYNGAYQEVLSAINGRCDIPRLGNTLVLPQKYINADKGAIVLPDTTYGYPVDGSVIWNNATSEVCVHNGVGWVCVTLT